MKAPSFKKWIHLGIAGLFGLTSYGITTAAIQLEPLLSGLTKPLYVTNAHDGSNRLFVVEQGGRVKVLQPGGTTPTVFLNITSKVVSGGEQGLLGLCFHPQYASNRRFFVDYTRAGGGATVIAEYHASVSDPNVADPTETVILTIPQPFSNHNGGMVEFGPDGFLYIGMGDGGSGNDPGNRAQDFNQLLGKILRINIDQPPAGGSIPYSSPSSNPYFGSTPGKDEIFALGLRNPWRFSFDRGTGQLYVGDVGQDNWEEVDMVTLGGNYGWRVFEGNHCTNLDPSLCNTPGNYIFPILEYGHTPERCSITGGYVYRGTRSSLPAGSYVYGDYCSGEIFLWNGSAQSVLLDTTMNISSFGEDESGEIYVVGLRGTVQRIATSASCTFAIQPTSQSFQASGGLGTVAVSTSSGCSWTAASNDSWITISSSTSFTGNGSVDYSVAANDSFSPRNGTITIAGQTFSVTQQAVGCSFSIAPASESFTAGAGAGSVAVSGPSLCGWTAVSNDSWISITSGSGGTGSGTVNYTVTPNINTTTRTGTLNIAGQNFTVTQTGQGGSTKNVFVPAGGVSFTSTDGFGNVIQTGYATVTWNASKRPDDLLGATPNNAPYGTAVFSLAQNGVVVSEAGVPASPPTIAARFFVDYRINAPAKIGREAAGTISVRTGFAAANQGNAVAHILMRLRDPNGATIATGGTTLAVNAHLAKFLDEFGQELILPASFASTGGFGSLEIISDQPLSLLALRAATNQRGETLITTTPVSDLMQPMQINSLYFPQMADGGGYQTVMILLNTSASPESGRLRFFDDTGSPLPIRLAGNSALFSQVPYAIPIGGLLRVVTDGSSSTVKVGWIQVTPESGSATPVGAGILSYAPGPLLLTETGVPSATLTTHARINIDQSNGHDTGIALSNALTLNSTLHVTLSAFQADGVTPAGNGWTSLDLNLSGHAAKFVGEFIAGLPANFVGVLDISASQPFVALTLRSLRNARGDFLLTTFPIADLNQPSPSPMIFAQVADGGGYTTQIILLGTGTSSTASVSFFGNDGSPIDFEKGVRRIDWSNSAPR